MSVVRVVITERRNVVSVDDSLINVQAIERPVVVRIVEGSESGATDEQLAAKQEAFAWILDLEAGNTEPSRDANDAEIADALAAVAESEVVKIFAPPGDWYFGSTISIVEQTSIEGAGEWYYGGTNFFFPPNTRFMEILRNSGSSALGATGTLVERIRLGPYAGGSFDEDTPGVFIETRCYLRDVDVTSAHGHGVVVLASTGDVPPTNANLARFFNVRCDANLGHGFAFRGADANSISVFACDASSNGGDGFRDASFLGVSLIDCHSEANVGKSFALGVNTLTLGDYTQEVNSRSKALNCYVEGGQGLVLLGPRCRWDGPHPPGGFDPDGTGAWRTDQGGNYEYFVNDDGGGVNNEVFFRAGRVNSAVAYELGSENDAYSPFQMVYGQLAGVALLGCWSYQYEGTDSLYAFFDDQFGPSAQLEEERRHLYFQKGFTGPQRSKSTTSARNLSELDTGKKFDNRGALADIALNLPLASQVADGWFVDMEVVASSYFRANAQGSDTIRWLGSTATFVRSTTRGDTWRVRKSTTGNSANGEWIVCNVTAASLLLGS